MNNRRFKCVQHLISNIRNTFSQENRTVGFTEHHTFGDFVAVGFSSMSGSGMKTGLDPH